MEKQREKWYNIAEMAIARDLTPDEMKKVCEFFAPFDVVLDFSRISFCKFAVENIGEMVADDEKTSEGEALRRFIAGAPVNKKLALLRALVTYYEERYPVKAKDDSPRGISFREIKAIVDDAIGSGVEIVPRMLLLGTPETDHLKAELVLAQDAIARGDFGSAVTKSKAALEGTLKYAVIKSRGEIQGLKDIPELLGMVRRDYGVLAGPGIPKQFNQFYTGVATTIDAIAQIRNLVGDSHGRATPAPEISDVHARLYVNISAALCEYVMSLVREKECYDGQ